MAAFENQRQRREARLREVREALELKHSHLLAGLYASEVGAEVVSNTGLEQYAERASASPRRRKKLAPL